MTKEDEVLIIFALSFLRANLEPEDVDVIWHYQGRNGEASWSDVEDVCKHLDELGNAIANAFGSLKVQ